MNLDSTYTYDTEGRMTAVQYPPSWNGMTWVAGPNLGNTYDSMGRLQKLTDLTASSDIISNATYGATGQLVTTTGAGGVPSETRAYNSIGQLTDLTSGSLHIQYAYSATNNNGKIGSETDVVSGETVTYTYDSLNRLASATSSVSPGWGQSYTYDGFGNMTGQTVTKGTAPALSVSYDAATNRQTGESADANGNLGGGVFDVGNRLTRNSGTLAWAYSYAPGNKRVWRGVWSSGVQTVDEITFWGANGQKLETYQVSQYQPYPADDHTMPQLVATATGTNYYFGGKLVKNTGGYVNPDRLGSIGKYFPYGQERPSATTDGKEKFATYFRDSETGLDYANNRYHQPGMGRFMTPDPYAASGGPSDPGSWNRYAYTRGDPVNRADPGGTDDCPVGVSLCSNIPESGGETDPFSQDCVGSICPLIDYPDGSINTNCFAAVQAQPSDPLFQECFGTPPVTVTAPAPADSNKAVSFAQAKGIWNNTKSFVDGHFNADKPGCQQVMAALGIDSTTWLGTMNAESPLDGTNATDVTMVSLFANGSPQVQARAAADYGNISVAAYLYAHPDVIAVSQLGGSAVYLNYSQVGISDPYALGAIMLHEALHNNLNFVDTTLETRLAKFGGRVGVPSSITSVINGNCF